MQHGCEAKNCLGKWNEYEENTHLIYNRMESAPFILRILQQVFLSDVCKSFVSLKWTYAESISVEVFVCAALVLDEVHVWVWKLV